VAFGRNELSRTGLHALIDHLVPLKHFSSFEYDEQIEFVKMEPLNPKLKMVGLSHVRDSDWPLLCKYLTENHSISTLKLSHANGNNNKLEELMNCLKEKEGITELSLTAFDSLAKNPTLFNDLLFSLKGLSVLKLKKSQFLVREPVLAFLSQGNLKSLTLDYCRLQSGDYASILKALIKSNSIEHLSLEGFRIGDTAFRENFSYLKQLTNLKYLNLTDNHLLDKSALLLAELIKMDFIEELYLGENILKSNGIHWIIAALKENMTLKVLILSQNGVQSDGLDELPEVLKINKTLQILDLKANTLPDLTEVIQAMKYNQALKQFGETSANRDQRATFQKILKRNREAETVGYLSAMTWNYSIDRLKIRPKEQETERERNIRRFFEILKKLPLEIHTLINSIALETNASPFESTLHQQMWNLMSHVAMDQVS